MIRSDERSGRFDTHGDVRRRAPRTVMAIALGLGCLACVAGGCGGEEPIRTYDAPKDTRPGMPDLGAGDGGGASPGGMGAPPMASGMAEATGQRIVAVIVPRGEDVWFVKLMGPSEGVDSVSGDLESFLGSIRFEDAEPGVAWTAPEGWRSLAPGMFATAKWALDEPGSLIVSLTKLTLDRFGDEDLLANVNRWRGQVGLAPFDVATLQRESRTVTVDGVESTRVDLDGSAAGGRAGSGTATGTGLAAGAPSGGSRADGDGTRAGGGAPGAGTPPRGSLAWTLPDGIVEASGSAMRVATLAAEAATDVDIAVTKFPGDVGGLLANVNRWRGQAGLSPVGAAELDGAIERIDVGGGLEVVLVDAPGTRTRVLAALVPGAGETWFVKASGPPASVAAMEPAFRKLVRSLRFEG